MDQRTIRWSFFLNISDMASGLALQTQLFFSSVIVTPDGDGFDLGQMRRIVPENTPLYIVRI